MKKQFLYASKKYLKLVIALTQIDGLEIISPKIESETRSGQMIRENYLKTIYNLMCSIRCETEKDRVDIDGVSKAITCLDKLIVHREVLEEINEDFEDDLSLENDEDDDEEEENEDSDNDDNDSNSCAEKEELVSKLKDDLDGLKDNIHTLSNSVFDIKSEIESLEGALVDTEHAIEQVENCIDCEKGKN